MSPPDGVLHIDCENGTAQMRPMTPDEMAARQALAELPDEYAAEAARRMAALEVVRAHAASDPAYAALATALGLL